MLASNPAFKTIQKEEQLEIDIQLKHYYTLKVHQNHEIIRCYILKECSNDLVIENSI